MERPDERKFSTNLYHEIPKRRAELVVATLAILRAYVCAGKPPQDFQQYGRFEEWSDLVRGSLVWLGLPDPVGTRRTIEASDPVRDQLRMLFTAWDDVIGTGSISVGELIAQAKHHAKPDMFRFNTDQEETTVNSALHESLMNITGGHPGQEVNPNRLGKWMAKYENRFEGGFKMSRAGRTREGAVMWELSKVA